MNLEKFTERARGFIQAAQTIAMRDSHQKLTPEHILKALLDDEEGLATNLISAAGGEPDRVRQALDLKLAKIPKVSGDAGQVYLDSPAGRVLDEAEKIAKKAGDSFVPAERILMALKMHGALTSAEVGARLGTTGEAARQQLVKLAEDGLVADERKSAGRGRPAVAPPPTGYHARFWSFHVDASA